MGSMSVSSCRCCMFVSYVHLMAVLIAAFCMACSLLMQEATIWNRLQTTQPTSGGDDTADTSCCACMFIVSKALLISSAIVIVRAGEATWLNPFATVLFTVCSSVTVECCVLYPCCPSVWYVCDYARKKALLQCLCNY